MEQRIDKWLWCVRLFKTRSQATDACKGGMVKLHGEDVKPSKDIRPGDRISVRKGPLLVQVEVKDIPKSRLGAKLLEGYVIDHTPPEEIERVRMIQESAFIVRDRGAGRPTKKERRDLDSWGLWE
jgi:ribosome-associated heat shock protein Hsp15